MSSYEYVDPIGVDNDQIIPPADFSKDRIYQTAPGAMFFVNYDSVMLNLDTVSIEIHTNDRVYNERSSKQPFQPIPVMHVFDLDDPLVKGFLLDMRYHDEIFEASRSERHTQRLGAVGVLGAIFSSQGACTIVPLNKASVLQPHADTLIDFTEANLAEDARNYRRLGQTFLPSAKEASELPVSKNINVRPK